MNIKYYHDFIGADDVVNRFEILQGSSTAPKLVEATNTPFSLEYLEVKKLEPVQGSQATLKLICESNFQFLDLHTDDMQGYMVKFYRSGQLFWIGYLDSELYNENLTDYAPYAVEFSGADFNILERLKFLDEKEKAYTDIAPFITQLKRCFNKLGLPFQKLYIGCSTVPEGISLAVSETALHVLYIQSANFYDEDGEPMSCREVIESILEPFGLMMVQRDASVYIYDLNTIKSGGVMKCYNFDTLSYIGDTAVDVQLGDIGEIGTMSTEASLGFEEMINNVTITSSLYAENISESVDLDKKNFSEEVEPSRPTYDKKFYRKSTQIENVGQGLFVVYYGRNYVDTVGKRESVIGCNVTYQPTPSSISPQFRIRSNKYITKVDQIENSRDYPFYINLKLSTYASTSDHPILIDKAEDVANSNVLKLYCNLYIVDDQDKIIGYYNVLGDSTQKWTLTPNGVIDQGKCVLWFGRENSGGSILDNWEVNANKPGIIVNKPGALPASLVGKGIYVNPDLSGRLVFEITNKCEIYDPDSGKMVDAGKIKSILYDKINLDVVNSSGESPSTDDYEFKSYINKKVESDYNDITLKCISANEDKLPVGKANILKKVDNHYELQLSYTRSGQTDILERLLMCTIHSNFTTKNKAISVDIKMTENPALRYVTYDNVLQSDGMYITGATLDFHNAKTTIKAVEFSADVDKLSDIPFD